MKTVNLFKLDLDTGQGIDFTEITGRVQQCVDDSGVGNGLLIIYTPHTTAAITINENADPAVKSDMKTFFSKMVPHESYFSHIEGNSPSHILSSLISPSQTFILESGRILLGTWQGIYFCEFDGPRTRKVFVKILHDK